MLHIKIISRSDGAVTGFEGKYVRRYDPAVHDAEYNGGLLELTLDPREAIGFSDARDAIEYWQQSYGTRPDGKPNRPLTAFTVEISNGQS